MTRTFGDNTWVWVSPTDTERFAAYVPKVRNMGFDMIEVALEDVGVLDYERAGSRHLARVRAEPGRARRTGSELSARVAGVSGS